MSEAHVGGGPYGIGIDIGGTKLLGVAVRNGQVHTFRTSTGPGASPDSIAAEVRRFVDQLGGTPEQVGIAVPGLVDENGRIVACSHLPRLVGWSPEDDLADFGCGVRVLNDADAALIEETRDFPPGATAGVVMIGTAIGAAFVVDGKPLRGTCGWAGELGYLPVPQGDRIGRLDELAGGAGIAARVGVSGAELKVRADAGDPPALAAIREGGAALGLGLAGVINLLNPSLLALGGGAIRLPGFYETALQIAERHTLPDLWRVCTIRQIRSGDTAVARGAARAATSILTKRNGNDHTS